MTNEFINENIQNFETLDDVTHYFVFERGYEYEIDDELRMAEFSYTDRSEKRFMVSYDKNKNLIQLECMVKYPDTNRVFRGVECTYYEPSNDPHLIRREVYTYSRKNIKETELTEQKISSVMVEIIRRMYKDNRVVSIKENGIMTGQYFIKNGLYIANLGGNTGKIEIPYDKFRICMKSVIKEYFSTYGELIPEDLTYEFKIPM